MELKVKKLTETAILPVKAHKCDLGYDIFSDETVLIKPGEYKFVKTGISILCNNGKYGFVIKDRSSVASKGLFTHAGVIDSGYIGEIKVLFHNANQTLYKGEINKGDKIAQLIPTEVVSFEVQETTSLTKTTRGDKGFGSTGK